MNLKTKVESQEVISSVPAAVNKATDAPSILIDGLSGASVSPHMVRIHCVEHIVTDGQTYSKHNITLAFDTEQFAKFADALSQVRDQMLPAGKKED